MLCLVRCCFQAVAPYFAGDILQFMLRFILSAGVDIKSAWNLIKHGACLSKFTFINTFCDM